MAEIIPSTVIAGVKFVQLQSWADSRGEFMETFRKAWFPERSWEQVQTNCSLSQAGVLRGLHYHFHQVDYWFCARGRIRVGLADLRSSSPTFRASQTVEIGDDNRMGIFIPVGIAHGFLALTDVTLSYVVDHYYDGGDEHGAAWNDPDLQVDWQVDRPLLSPRDQANPRLQQIDSNRRPR